VVVSLGNQVLCVAAVVAIVAALQLMPEDWNPVLDGLGRKPVA
jgi:hypothetical protein